MSLMNRKFTIATKQPIMNKKQPLIFFFLLLFSSSLFSQNTTATYRLTFDAAWSRTTHPYQFPFDARWSPVVGLTHNMNAALFEPGDLATQGIVNMSQTGSRDPLNDEIQAIINGGGGQYLINAQTRVNPSPDTVSTVFEISSSHPYVSLASMIAPSPDWFVALRNLNLLENGEWVESKIVQFHPYDSGSDNGLTFASPNNDTQPRTGIEMITDGPLFANGQMASLGTWRFERIDNASACEVNGGSLVGGPFEFCVDGTADNIPAGAITVNGATGTNSQWVITDDRGYILGLPPSFTAPNFDAAGVGLCFVYHLSYEDGLIGLEAGNNIEDLEGCFNLSNSTYVDRQSDDETCNPNETASYRVIFDARWSGLTHPVDYPSDARWSPAVGMTHNAETSFFLPGTVASQGIVNMSQTGSRDPLNDEIDRFISSGGAGFRINATTRVNPSPDTVSFQFDINSAHPMISLVSMIAPSPDWFVALKDLNLFENGEWAESRIAQFRPYDSGSDSGVTFASDNEDTQPREGISPITDGPLVVNGNIASLGLWRIERIDAASNCNGVFGGELVGGPFEFCVDGTPDNIPAGAITVNGATGTNNQWVVTDDRGYILGLPPSFTAPDFDAAGVGLCFVYHLTYEDGLTGLAAGNNIEDLEGCFSLSNSTYVNREDCTPTGPAVGAVYAMSNGAGQVDGNVQGPNTVVAYGQAADGTLTLIGEYPTGGNGGDYDGGEGLDPLISAYAITKTVDNRFVLVVNAGSNTVTSMKVNDDFSLTVVDTEDTGDIGPNSIAHTLSAASGVNGLVYVSNISRPEFLALGEPAQQGSVIGYKLMDNGSLEPIANSTRDLANRPSAVQFSPGGDFLVVASINAGASALASGSQDEIVVYTVNADGTLSADAVDGATSTLRGNAEGRNLPSAIGFQIVGDNYVVVTEAREFQPNGAPPAFPALQDGSVSTWQIQANGTLQPINMDVASGENNTGRTACWLDFSDENTFFVSNALEAGLASYSFNDGNIELLNQVAAQGTGATGNTTDPGLAFGTTEGWIDLWISDDGKYLYQAYGLAGTVGVYAINGTELTLIQEVSGDLPMNNVQGIVSVGEIGVNPNPGPAVGAVYAMSNGAGQVDGNVQGPNTVVAYGQAADGTLTLIGEYPTGGNGGDYDGGEGLDPLISAYAITKTVDNRFVLVVNAGSNTVTSMKVNDDFSLTVVDTEDTGDIGPNSIAHTLSAASGVNGLVYVSNISRPEFLALGEPAQQGSVIGYKLMDNGSLEPIANSTRDLANRPSAVQFSPNGDFLVVASINAGASALASGSQDEIVVYTVNADGTLSANQTAGATSTLRDNAEGRNLPSAIGFQIVGDNYVVVTEAREFQPNGAPPAFPALQDGSVSTWQIQANGTLQPINMDVASGENNTGRTACWLDFSDENTFFVSNALEAGLASYSFNDGNIELLNQVAAQGTGATGNTTDPGLAFGTTEGWIDLWISDDGKYLYQAYGLAGTVGVYGINGTELTFIQEVSGDLPMNNIQGIVSVGEIGVNPNPPAAVGAVYAMSNGAGQVDGNVQGPNTVVAYGQAADGTLTLIGEYPTGGNGGDFDGGEGLDPLISAYAITKTIDNRFVLVVNAGSNTVTSMKVNDDFSLTVVDTEDTGDIGPNSIAHTPSIMSGVNGLVYVSNISRPEFLALGEPAQQGSIIGYKLMDNGSLEPIANSTRDLANRPSAVQFSPGGDFLVVASINAGASALASGSQDEIVVYTVNADGTLSANQTAGATSTLRDNAEGRNLPSAIGFQIVGDNYVVVTEAREFQPNGAPPAFPALQDGSVSTWQIQANGTLQPINMDVASGENNTGRTACWLDFSDENTFFVSNALEAGLASYSFNDGNIELLNQVAAQGTGATGNTTDPGLAFGTTEGWIDLWISDDGKYLYQAYGLAGTVGVYGINGTELTFIQEVSGDLPMNNIQGIVSVGEIGVNPNPPAAVGAVYAMSNGAGQVDGNVQGPNTVVAYGQAADGTLTLIGEYPTGGNGGDFDGGEGLDPLISAYAITKTIDNRFVLVVNAGSNTVTSMKVNDDFSLTVVDTEDTGDIGPNSIAHTPSIMSGVNGLVYVSNISRPEFLALGEPAQQGSIIGYKLMDNGSLEPIANSTRDLANRPSAVQFSPGGDFLVVASINAGASALASGSQDEIVVYTVNADGTLSANQTAGATSTLRDNTEGRNLPSAIGFQIVGDNYVVVTEAREFQPNGAPPAFPALQDGSVSTWQIQANGTLQPINMDVASGENNTGRTACWLDFSDENTFFVSNALEAGLASYSFNDGNIELLNQVAAQGTGATGNTTDPGLAFGTTEGWIDLWISDDGKYLYQAYGLAGTVGVYAINGTELTLIQEVSGDLPMNNIQGIVSVGQPGNVNFVDLNLDINVANTLYDIYEEVDYTITVTNEGTVEATNIAIDAGLPTGMVFTDAQTSLGTYSLFFEEWAIDALAPGQTATLDLTLFTLIEGVNIDQFVEVIALDQDDADSTPGNGTGTPVEDDEALVTITPADDGGFGGQDGEANLSLTIDADTDAYNQFENIVFTITLTNDGPDEATDVEVAAGLPRGLVYTSHNTTGGDYNLFFETWTVESLASGASVVLELNLFTLIADEPITAFTEVFIAGQFDPNSTPGNGNGQTANEDDEAVVIVNANNTLTFRNNTATSEKVFMNRLYPSPAVSEINLELVNSEEFSDAIISVYDLQGKRLIQQDIGLANGFNEYKLNIEGLAEGNYFVNVLSENGTTITKRFLKVNR